MEKDAQNLATNVASGTSMVKSQGGHQPTGDMRTEAFISYSRKDTDFVDKLDNLFKSENRRIWIDRTDIRYGERWQKSIQSAIEASNNFLFVISPNSIISRHCKDELDYALSQNKRILPIMYKEVKLADLPHGLSDFQVFPLPDSQGLRQAFSILLKAIDDADPEYLDMHTNLLRRANSWNKKGRNKGSLLPNKDLQEAEEWRAQSRVVKEPKPTQVQLDFISASRKARDKNRTTLVSLIVIAFILISGSAVFAFISRQAEIEQRRLAEQNEQEAKTQRDLARTNLEEAERQRARAVEKENDAKRQRDIADENAKEAERQTEIARKNEQEAKTQQRIAETNELKARQRLIALYEEQGRRELLSGDPQRALMYLSQAYQEGGERPSLRLLLGWASWAINSQVASFPGHKKRVSTVAFNRDGSRVITASQDRTAKVWDAVNGKLIASLSRDQGWVLSAKISADGERALTLARSSVPDSDLNELTLWNIKTGEAILKQGDEYNDYIFSNDGTLFMVTRLGDTRAEVYDAKTGKKKFTLNGHNDDITSVAFDLASNRIISASANKIALNDENGREEWSGDPVGEVAAVFFNRYGGRYLTKEKDNLILWSTDSSEPCSINLPVGNYKIKTSTDGERIVIKTGQTIQVWNTLSRATTQPVTLPKKENSLEEFSPDLRHIVQVAGSELTVWDTETGKQLASFNVLADEITTVAFRRGGDLIFTFGSDFVGRLWSWKDVVSPLRRTLQANVKDVVFSEDGKRLITRHREGFRTETQAAWDIDEGVRLATPDAASPALMNVAVSPDGTRAVAIIESTADVRYFPQTGGPTGPPSKRNTGAKAIIRVVATGRLIAPLDGVKGEITLAKFSPDGRLVATNNEIDYENNSVVIWDSQTGAHISTITLKEGITDFRFSHDGRRIITTTEISDEGQRMRADVWVARSGKRLTLLGISYRGNRMGRVPILSPDGQCLITASNDTVSVWNIGTSSGVAPEPITILEGHIGGITCFEFSPDGNHILTGSQDKTARIWDARSGVLLSSLNGHTGPITSAMFSPKGEFILTASEDKTAKVWDADTGQLLASLIDHRGALVSAAFRNDTEQVVTASQDNILRVWDIKLERRKPDSVVETVKRLIPYKFYRERLLPVTVKSMPDMAGQIEDAARLP